MPFSYTPKVRRTAMPVLLSERERAIAAALGEGNISRGIRKALQASVMLANATPEEIASLPAASDRASNPENTHE